MLSDGDYGIISSVEIEHFDEPQTTYNFEVADFHTYYVGTKGIIVHNTCPTEIVGKTHATVEHQAETNRIAGEMANSGDYSKIYLNRLLSTTGVKSGSYLRPDIIGVNKTGGFSLVEVASKSQVMGTAAYNSLQANISFYNTLSNVNSIRFIPWGY